jgi:hypothetical protein
MTLFDDDYSGEGILEFEHQPLSYIHVVLLDEGPKAQVLGAVAPRRTIHLGYVAWGSYDSNQGSPIYQTFGSSFVESENHYIHTTPEGWEETFVKYHFESGVSVHMWVD